MVKSKTLIFIFLILFFLLFSFYPTIFELNNRINLSDQSREFILEHNYYWPDYNLYLSKIRQGFEGHFLASEKYTSEIHRGSLIQEFYIILGHAGRLLGLPPDMAYLLGRIVFSILLMSVILLLVKSYFSSFFWQITAFLIVAVSGSFPKIIYDSQGILHIVRYMEWWSNIDALQRITFIPHILFGQVVSFYLLYQIVINNKQKTINKFIIFVLLGNTLGLTFPPSLITLNTVILLTLLLHIFKNRIFVKQNKIFAGARKFYLRTYIDIIFIIFSLPSLIYIYFLTKQIPWSALVTFHRTHPMMIPFWEYILGTGPIFFLGMIGAVVAVIRRDRKFFPLIYWVLVTFFFAIFFTHIKDQSPLRFTQTGLFIPLGILGAYFFYQLFHLSYLGHLSNLGRRLIRTGIILFLTIYLLFSLFMMSISLDWQTGWITQRLHATIPLVPYPPQAMYPLKDWMKGIRWLRDNTNHNDAVLAAVTAGNYIPAYSGNTVYFGQANTYDYERKQLEVNRFFKGEMSSRQAELFLKNGNIKWIFFSLQEKELSNGKSLLTFYPFLKPNYSNPLITIYSFSY